MMRLANIRLRHHGFTLIEVLVALAILAIALSASMRTLNLATDSARDSRERLISTWVLQNRLAEMEARRLFPPEGETRGETDYAGLRIQWKQVVKNTPNPAFRRVELSAGLSQDYALATLTGFAVQTP
jgi:general secretion pathway protein I